MLGKTNAITLKFLLPSLYHELWLNMMSYSMEYLFGQFGAVLLDIFPPSLLLSPNLLTWEGGGREWENLDTVQEVLSKQPKHCCVIHAVLIPKTNPHTGCDRRIYLCKFIPAKPSSTIAPGHADCLLGHTCAILQYVQYSTAILSHVIALINPEGPCHF